MKLPFPRKHSLSTTTKLALAAYRDLCEAEAALFRARTQYARWAAEVPPGEAAAFNEECGAIRERYNRERMP